MTDEQENVSTTGAQQSPESESGGLPEKPARELLEQELHRSAPRSRKSKKDYIESLRHRRLLALDRAAFIEELIEELGGTIEEPPITASAQGASQRGREDVEEEEEEEFEFSGQRASGRQGGRRPRQQAGKQDEGGGSSEAGSSPEATGEVPAEGVTVEGKPDKRFKGAETQKEYEQRHRGDDGRGQVTDPAHDRRLKGNETPELAESRRRGDDGRGRVTEPETDLRKKENLGKRQDAGSR